MIGLSYFLYLEFFSNSLVIKDCETVWTVLIFTVLEIKIGLENPLSAKLRHCWDSEAVIPCGVWHGRHRMLGHIVCAAHKIPMAVLPACYVTHGFRETGLC